jgi:hypothetical protein
MVDDGEKANLLSPGPQLLGHLQGHAAPEGITTQVIGALRLEVTHRPYVVGGHGLDGLVDQLNTGQAASLQA